MTAKDTPEKKKPTRRTKPSPAAPSIKPKKITKAKAPKVSAEPKSPVKIEEPKLVRGRFTLPEADFDKIAALKRRARQLGRPAKKNELLRIGLGMLGSLSDEQLVVALDQLA